jgi:TRAP-type transport system small permease protein
MDIDQDLGLRRDSLFDAVTLYTATALFGVTIALTVVQVFARQLGLQSLGPMYLTEPLARFTLIIATFLGAAVAARNDENIKMTLITDRLENYSPSAARSLRIVSSAIVVGFVAIAMIATFRAALGNWHTSIGGVRIVTEGYLYLGISIGLAVFLFYETTKIGEELGVEVGQSSEATTGSDTEEL